MLHLPSVTLFSIDTTDWQRGTRAFIKGSQGIEFGHKVFIGQSDYVKDYETYNQFIVQELHKFFDTAFVLVMQHDGYAINPNAWTDEFLNYDYVGAPWGGGVVGNGGFSLRSKRFCVASSQIDSERYAPEDQLLCEHARRDMEQAGCTFAPEPLARRFSWELHDDYPEYEGSFGFHGKHSLERMKALKIL